MFCPRCGAEYREGFDTCADCGVPLVNEMPPPVSETPDPADLVTILETNDPVLIGAAKSWLQSADIPFVVRGELSPSLMSGIESGRDLMLRGAVQIQVEKSEEENARDLLSELEEGQAPGDTGDGTEEEEDEAPPTVTTEVTPALTIAAKSNTPESPKMEVRPEEKGITHGIEEIEAAAGTKALFRAMVLAELALAFLCLKLGSLASESAPADVKTYLGSMPHSEAILQIRQSVAFVFTLFFRFLAAMGLMAFWRPARILYLALWLWTIIIVTYAGATIMHGTAVLCLYLDLLLGGAILAEAYFSSVKPAFRKREKGSP